MTRRANLAAGILALAAAFSGLILLSGMGGAMPSKARLLVGLVQPLVHSFGAIGAIAVLMGLGLLGATAIWLWPSLGANRPLGPAPESQTHIRS